MPPHAPTHRPRGPEVRAVPAVVATFNPGQGLLSVFGDAADNSIAVGRNAAGELLVNGGAVDIIGGTATVANTTSIQIFGQAGNDTLSLDETNGALPAAQIFGGSDNDTIDGGSGGDLLFGQAGNDVLNGRGGNDSPLRRHRERRPDWRRCRRPGLRRVG
ncbi:MAG: hypothetical protein U0794_03395 [Isosphaeraceae bacterium]